MDLMQEALNYEPKMRKYIGSHVPPEEVEDILQDTYEGIVKASFGGRCKPTTWCNSIMRRKVADFYRGRRELLSTLPGRLVVEPSIGAVIIEDVLNRLPEKEREVAELLVIGMSIREISTELGKSYECIRTRYRRAMERIGRM